MITSLRSTAVKLFVFTAVTIVATMWLASVIGNIKFFSSPYEITAQFTDATGLLNGDVVKAAGVTVGRVNSVEVRDGVAVVTIGLDEGVELPKSLGAQIRFRNLIGQRMINLVELPDGEEGTLQSGDLISLDNTEPAFDLTALFNGLRPLIRSTNARDINVVSQAITEALRGRSDEVEGILANLADVADTVSARDTELAKMLDNLNVITEDLAGRDVQLSNTLADLGEFLGDIAASRDDLAAALVTLDDAASRFRRIIERNDSNIRVELADLSTILDAVDDKRRALRQAIRLLPEMLVAVERVTGYGEWANVHLIDVCKDDTDTCGKRVAP